ncbi:MAG: hypothetical protein AAF433_02340 [Bacteroidota bacterium]
MTLKSIGKLLKDTNNYPLNKDWISSSKVSIPFFDHQELPLRIDHSDYSGDWLLDEIDLALLNFLRIGTDSQLKLEAAKKAFENWKNFNDDVGYLDGIASYRSVKNRPEWMERSLQNCLWLEKLTSPEKVWAYIQPTEIIVTKDRYEKKEGVFIQILCECTWEEEHGLQIVLKNGNELIRVSDQDGHLFDYYDQDGNPIEE